MQRSNFTKHVSMVKGRMEDIAERVTRTSQRQMEKQALKVMALARDYAPHDEGHLDNPDNWTLDKKRDGMNRRNTFTVRLMENRPVTREDGRTVRLRTYARFMHDGINGMPYKLGPGSRDKAAALSLGKEYTGAYGKYVGMLFLTRAAEHTRKDTEEQILKAVRREL